MVHSPPTADSQGRVGRSRKVLTKHQTTDASPTCLFALAFQHCLSTILRDTLSSLDNAYRTFTTEHEWSSGLLVLGGHWPITRQLSLFARVSFRTILQPVS